jgi:outer membrane protein assembly factor BamD (BamD/ComL family)
LSLSKETPIIRYLELPDRIRPLPVKPPLKVLVMISSPYNFPTLGVEREWMQLTQVLRDLELEGLVMLERMEKATLAALQRQLRQGEYHIFHFIGHGGFDQQAKDGILMLEDDEGRGRAVSGQYLGTLLHNHRPLRSTLLNACEGARSSRSDPFSGTAQSLMQQGIPAVIAMQFEITDEAAIVFTREFYAAVADGEPIDAAMVEARAAIFAQGDNIEWGTPVLYLRSPDGRIFDIERMNSDERRKTKIAVLYRKAKAALDGEEWQAASELLEEVLALEPSHVEARTSLRRLPEEQELAKLYLKSQEHYEAGQWSETLSYLRRMQETRPHYKNVDDLIVTAERSQDEQNRRNQIAALLNEAKAAVANEDWRMAIAKYQRILRVDPAHAEAKARLVQVNQELDLADLYNQGQAHYDAKRWSLALECFYRIQKIKLHYKKVDDLIAAAEKARDEQSRRGRISALICEAKEAGANEDWHTALDKYQTVLEAEPTHAGARAGLREMQQEQGLTDLYAKGQEHYQARRWQQAFDCLRRVQEIRPHYKQVDDLVAALTKSHEEQTRLEKAAFLFREAKIAMARENWISALKNLQAVLTLDPIHAEAKTDLIKVRQEQELVELYVQGHDHYEAQRWSQALVALHRLQSKRAHYKDVEALVALINQKKQSRKHAPTQMLIAFALVLLLIILGIRLVPKLLQESPPSLSEASLSITTTPDHATILLNRDSVGVTPLRNYRTKAGKYFLRIQKYNYVTLDSVMVFTADQSASLFFSLKAVKSMVPAVISSETTKGMKESPKPEPVVEAPKVGAVQIISQPARAEIFLNGQSQGATPRTLQNLTAGDYDILLKKDGYEDFSTTATITGGKVKMVNAPLAALKGTLRVLIKPFGSITIDGVLQKPNVTDWYKTRLAVGTHRVKMETAGLGFLEKTVKIEANKQKELIIDFNKMVTLTVTAFDESDKAVRSNIYVDGNPSGHETPKKFKLRVGHHIFTVRRENYTLISGAQNIDLEADLDKPLKFVLRKIQ